MISDENIDPYPSILGSSMEMVTLAPRHDRRRFVDLLQFGVGEPIRFAMINGVTQFILVAREQDAGIETGHKLRKMHGPAVHNQDIQSRDMLRSIPNPRHIFLQILISRLRNGQFLRRSYYLDIIEQLILMSREYRHINRTAFSQNELLAEYLL